MSDEVKAVEVVVEAKPANVPVNEIEAVKAEAEKERVYRLEGDRVIGSAAKLGLSPEFAQALLVQFGPLIAQLLLKVLEDKLRPRAFGFTDVLGETWLKKMLVQLLSDYRDLVLRWVNDGEAAVYDAVVALVSSRSLLLAAALAKYKETIVGLDDELTRKILDQTIDLLEKSDK